MKKVITLSVHDVVDTLLRTGSIDNRVFSTGTMNEGTRLHGIYQGEQGAGYYSEVALNTVFTIEDCSFIVEGRADGIIVAGDDVTIDEIKTTIIDLQEFHEENKEWHLGQAKFYAYMYALQNNLTAINVRLTYISQKDFSIKKYYIFEYTFTDLKNYVHDLMANYYAAMNLFLTHEEKLKVDAKNLVFPYPVFRSGQKEMIATIFKAAENGTFAYIEAPTGIGKTAATLYPYVKLLCDRGEKIFYLTSKNSIKKLALDTVDFFNHKGIELNAITINSKENMCINEKIRHCNPDECPFTVNYYQKINTVIHEIYQKYPCLGYQEILDLGRYYNVCPFEMQLDLSTFYDIIIADYNHLFHPSAHLMRFFESGPRPYFLLIDEAHNLPGRVREMHSASIDFYSFYLLYIELKPLAKEHKKIYRLTKAIMNYFLDLNIADFDEEDHHSDVISCSMIPAELLEHIDRFFEEAKDILVDNSDLVTETFLDVYYKAKTFLDMPVEDKSFAYFFNISEGKLKKFNVICLDSRPYLKPAKDIFLSGTFFSATLAPKEFYLDLLGAEEESEQLFLPSPFPAENQKVLIAANISTYYKDRNYTIEMVAKSIKAFVSGKTGNYFVFFPSYKYMELCTSFFSSGEKYNIYVQDSHMGSDDREEFLSHFVVSPNKTNIGFVVLGGIFAEGIDLIDDRLIGAVIVGVGLSMISYENDCLRSYYGGEDDNLGYYYAYVYPGINRFLQAAGRVIRSEKDRGMLLFIDTRYQKSGYKDQLVNRYENVEYVESTDEILSSVHDFWRNKHEI